MSRSGRTYPELFDNASTCLRLPVHCAQADAIITVIFDE